MKDSRIIQFDGNCLIILRSNLLAVSPQEGCALLIGEHERSNKNQQIHKWQIRSIWPCCNIWEPGLWSINESAGDPKTEDQDRLSRKNRFSIDPREQIQAQIWARKHSWTILGSAHSHPSGNAYPSSIDYSWSFSPGLMAIVDKLGTVNVWWIANDQYFQKIEIANLNNEQEDFLGTFIK